jgi:hypothetical protein
MVIWSVAAGNAVLGRPAPIMTLVHAAWHEHDVGSWLLCVGLLWNLLLAFQVMAAWQSASLPRQRRVCLVCALIGLAVLGASVLPGAGNLTPKSFATAQVLAAAFLLIPFMPAIRRAVSAARRHHGRRSIKRSLAYYLVLTVALTLYSLLILTTPFYQGTYYDGWRVTFFILYGAFFILGFPIIRMMSGVRGQGDLRRDRIGFVLVGLWQYVCAGGRRRAGPPAAIRFLLSRPSLKALRESLVKAFFLPVMTVSYFAVCNALAQKIHGFRTTTESHGLAAARQLIPGLRDGILLVDVGIAVIGYLATLAWLGTRVRSVERTFSGWGVALICYPPFNALAGTTLLQGYEAAPLLGSNAALGTVLVDVSDFAARLSPALDLLELVLFAFYGWATMSLGLRFSNLTNRGTVAAGPYAFIRHPAYTAKVTGWWIVLLRFPVTAGSLFGLILWSVVYLLRALTEERHLSQDADYRSYREVVRWRFLPRVL